MAGGTTLNTDISSRGDEIKLEAEGDIDITGQTLETTGKEIKIDAGKSGSGELIASDATLDTNKKIDLKSNGDMHLDGATIDAGNDHATADLRDGGATIFVDGASISDDDDTLVYKPEDASQNGTPSSGSVTSDD